MRDLQRITWSAVNMYAVIANGGKQYYVAEGQIVKLEKIDAEAGNTIEFDQVLMLTDGNNITLGAPFIKSAKVKGEIIEQGRGKKINVIKFRRRKHHMKRMGHRQSFTAVRITGIEASQE
jgi:large subunit ribosomal protein L21